MLKYPVPGVKPGDIKFDPAGPNTGQLDPVIFGAGTGCAWWEWVIFIDNGIMRYKKHRIPVNHKNNLNKKKITITMPWDYWYYQEFCIVYCNNSISIDDPSGWQGFCLLNNVAIGAAYAWEDPSSAGTRAWWLYCICFFFFLTILQYVILCIYKHMSLHAISMMMMMMMMMMIDIVVVDDGDDDYHYILYTIIQCIM